MSLFNQNKKKQEKTTKNKKKQKNFFLKIYGHGLYLFFEILLSTWTY